MKPDAAAGIDGIPPCVLRMPALSRIITILLNNHCILGGNPDAQFPKDW
jgi:hypothetical protein